VKRSEYEISHEWWSPPAFASLKTGISRKQKNLWCNLDDSQSAQRQVTGLNSREPHLAMLTGVYFGVYLRHSRLVHIISRSCTKSYS